MAACKCQKTPCKCLFYQLYCTPYAKNVASENVTPGFDCSMVASGPVTVNPCCTPITMQQQVVSACPMPCGPQIACFRSSGRITTRVNPEWMTVQASSFVQQNSAASFLFCDTCPCSLSLNVYMFKPDELTNPATQVLTSNVMYCDQVVLSTHQVLQPLTLTSMNLFSTSGILCMMHGDQLSVDLTLEPLGSTDIQEWAFVAQLIFLRM